MSSILLFIPAKNEATTIADVICDSQSVIKTKLGIDADVLVISDGSTDETVKKAKAVDATVITHAASQGLGTIFREAVEYAVQHHYDYLVTIDGDKQFDESEISTLLQPLMHDQADFVSGNRFMSGNDIKHMSAAKKVGNRIVAQLVNYILASAYTDVSCGFRAYSREALLHLNLHGGFTYTQEVFLNLGFKGMRIKEVPISVTYFPARKSRIASKLFTYGYQVLKIMLSSLIFYRPMKFFGTIAAWLWIFSIPTLLILTVRYIETGLISPFKAIGITSLVMFSLGALLLVLGTILFALSRQQLSIDRLLYHSRKHIAQQPSMD